MPAKAPLHFGLKNLMFSYCRGVRLRMYISFLCSSFILRQLEPEKRDQHFLLNREFLNHIFIDFNIYI